MASISTEIFLRIYSIGHSSSDWDHFKLLIEGSDIGAVLDVRSNPRSRFAHFSTPGMRLRLNSMGVSYVYLGDQLGGRPQIGATSYNEMAASVSFRCGINRALEIAARCNAAMLCAEHAPLTCHRCLLVGRYLHEHKLADVRHILRDGNIEPHSETEERLLAQWDSGGDLFRNRSDRIEIAYRLQARKIGADW